MAAPGLPPFDRVPSPSHVQPAGQPECDLHSMTHPSSPGASKMATSPVEHRPPERLPGASGAAGSLDAALIAAGASASTAIPAVAASDGALSGAASVGL